MNIYNTTLVQIRQIIFKKLYFLKIALGKRWNKHFFPENVAVVVKNKEWR